MAALRSNLPSRLRQLLSTEGAIGPSVKRDSETPPKIKAFIDKVIQSPLQDIAIPLSGFRWEFSKYFKLLLASTDPEILIASLETLCALVKINPSKLHSSGKLVACGSVNCCLLSLAQGWGSKEEGLGLYSCVIVNEKSQEEGLSLFPSEVYNDCDKSQNRLGSTLYFEFRGANSHSTGEDSDVSNSPSGRVIHIPDLHLRKDDDLSLMKQCIDEYMVPPEHRFSLLTRIRYAHAFRSPRICRLYSRVCLLAFIVLVQSSDAHDELVSFFANEPEYTNELIRIVRSEETVPGTVRTLAMHALAAQLGAYSASHERAHILSGSSISFAGGNRMILLNVLQRAIFSLNNSNDPSSIAFVEALLQFYLLHVISSSTSGSVVRGSGMVPTFLPLLQDSDSTHMLLVCLAVKTLQKLMDYSNTAVTLFKDLGGIEILTHRVQKEANIIIELAQGNDNLMVIGEGSRYSDDQLYSQKRLIRVLLKALGSATYAPANSTRSQNLHDASLPATLSLIFKNVDKFGGDIFSSAVTVMSEIIHKDPTCFPALHELGLPDAFLASVVAGILPSSKALTCVPNGLGAICLNAKGLEAVKETSALRFLVDVFTSRKYVIAMSEGMVPLANAVEELLRHVSSLRSTGVDLIIEIVNKIASIGDKCVGSTVKVNESNAIKIDSEDKENEAPCCLVSATDSTAAGITDEHFIQLCIFHVMVLVHRVMENAETCRLFVEKSGIEALLKLLLRPSIVQSSEGMSIAFHSTMVFKGFTQHHSAPLARAFCSSLRDHLKKTLSGFSAASGSFLLDHRTTPDSEVISYLFLVEFVLFLAASKDNRWITALLTEFGNESKDVLGDIGRVQCEVLWQIALLEDAKLEMDDDDVGSVTESRQSELNPNETEEQRFNSFRQFLDPLLRRRMSGFSFESQFFDLINLYRDLSRTSGLQQRQSTVNPSNLLLGSSHLPHQPGSSDGVGASGTKEDYKKRSYSSSCCDMVKSLSLHITHLFQELGKVMLLPSRRRDDVLNVSPSSKSVASTFATVALDLMNFGGHVSSSGSEVSASTKCRYFGKVIDFIDAILLEKSDSCNPVLVNCLYSRGVILSVLTTFEATSQLPFAANRHTASLMETDEGISKQDEKEHTDDAWIYGPLVSYGKLMDHLVTSSFILSPFTKHLLTQPLINGDIPFPRDAETFVKILQSMVLKAVLPIWTHPQFTEYSYEFIATIVSILRHIYSGVEVKNVSSSIGARVAGPPPNESTITTIVEMGFSRSRAEEALRQVGSNSVELAMEWLFSHPEEVQEDDEFARAVAMSLEDSGSDTKEDVVNENNQNIEEETIHPPPVEDLLLTCTKLLQMKESLAFPVRDLMVMICSQNDGQYRSNVLSHIIEQVKLHSFNSGNGNMLYALFHVLALIFHQDAVAREGALTTGLVKVASDLLSYWVHSSCDSENSLVPKWVTAAFLAMDRLLQVDQKLNADIAELLKKDDFGGYQTSILIDEDKQNKLLPALGLSSKHISIQEQKGLIEIACHSVSFLDTGGLPLLLSLPASSLFVGFDSISATIIRHILEDPQTLQQAMESEIRHSVVPAANRQSNGKLTPRNFLLNLTSVISRDPVIFMQAAQSVCQVEMVGERPYIVLLKDKCKEKEKTVEKDKAQTADGKAVLGNINSSGPGNGHGKLPDLNSKNVKVHRKPPQSFVKVIELLLDSVITFVPPLKDESLVRDTSSLMDMDVDMTGNKGKGKAIVSLSQEDGANDQELCASLAKIVFILKLLTEVLLMYSSSIHILLRRDTEISSFRGPPQHAPTGHCPGGIFHHILHKFLPYSRSSQKDKKTDTDWKHKLASRASQFVVASCVRSTEARRRVFMEVNTVFNDFVDSSTGFRHPGSGIPALIDLLNDIVAARTPTGSYISAEASASFIDVGLVTSLTRILQVLDLDHVESPKVVTGLVKVLEIVTKEHINAADCNPGKAENSTKPPDQSQHGVTDNSGDIPQSMETISQNQSSAAADRVESFDAVQTYGGSEAVTDMEHDQDLDDGFAPANEDEYMHETPEDTRDLQNGLDNVGIRFEIQPQDQENLVDEDDDDEMSGDDGDEDEEHNDLEDEIHHLPHPDTDQEDHELDEDEFDEEVMEEEDEDEDEEDGVILRLEEGINGINVIDHIEVLGRDRNFANETLHVMPVEVFGSRRQGRTTSIYNLLGRTGNNITSSQHPLLMEPSSSLHTASLRQSENAHNIEHSDRNSENTSSRLDAIFRTLRNGRQGHRFNLWTDDSHQTGGSNSSTIPQGLEDLLVSHLRRPAPEKPADQDITPMEPQSKVEVNQLQESGAMMPENPAENNGNIEEDYVSQPSSTAVDSSGNADIGPTTNESPQGINVSITHTQSVEMQFDNNAAAGRDVEAVSQESNGSGATLGESLRSLDVEIGSADGHDDGGERQGSVDTRTRRTNVSFGNSTPLSGRDASLGSVTEVPENHSPETDQVVQAGEQLANGDDDSGPIDPAFLDALPEELRAEVLSAQQGQVAQPSNAESQNTGDIDPEFLAALPPDIREEVLAQQQAQRITRRGSPDTSSPDVLANLTPALVAEANMLRERFTNRYDRTLFGMYPRNRRGESSRRGVGIGSTLGRAGGIIARRSMGSKPVEAEGAPLVDTEALVAMVRLLRVVQPLYKSHLPRLLLNLCANNETRTALVKIFIDLLRLDIRKPVNDPIASEPSYRLYGCQNHVLYSRPQSFDGVPPLVSRRVLETLTYLARNHPYVAKILLQFKVPQPRLHESENVDKARSKAVMIVEEDTIEGNNNVEEDTIEGNNNQEGSFSIALLLNLLSHPLYLRSIAHLEQLLNLLEVIIDNVETKSSLSDVSGVSAAEQTSDPQISTSDAEIITGSGSISSGSDIASSKPDDSSKPSASSENAVCDTQTILHTLPPAELQLLCSLLAREGLSDNAYTMAAEVLRKLVAIAPCHCHLLITELANSVQNLTKSAMDELHHIVGEAEKALLTATSSDGASILRVLQALSSLVTSIDDKDKDRRILSENDHTAALSLVYDISTALGPLWLELSACISKIESYSDSPSSSSSKSSISPYKTSGVMPPLPAGTQNILPYIESFFVMCEKLQPGQYGVNQDPGLAAASDVEDATTSASQQKSSGGALRADEKHLAFVKFSDKHRKLLNAFIRQNPGLLEKSFSLMLKVPRFIDF
ncbi:ubiquitin-protein ligase 2 [Actinidia rufa]|uniref:Ubiquitin-protein ligase 2 n=1 Tax=Actinidia rufa TaxID=165716 RepID=A0A7J0EHF6_9ERIC|nr:ubiquitin-protein ligase 2 [Actinidia rufa]